jgi:hypothetical protein
MAAAPLIDIVIPDGLRFSDLRLRWNRITEDLDYELGVIAAIMRRNDLDPESLLGGQNARAVAGLVLAIWYGAHRRGGGQPNLIMEQLIAEANAQMEYGEERVQHSFGHLH